MTIPNALAFARNYQIPNTKLSPPLLLHCVPSPWPLAHCGRHLSIAPRHKIRCTNIVTAVRSTVLQRFGHEVA